ncbi:hypothetical protein [Paenibacillus sp. YN15]|uniref:hypothetical protein n=1 Tax=Paenibacillus sp. YN15 TaxID=1742774 RepID=UPI000DCD17C5|nr:hypothetical protein [Paenibacillus sp. YN15]RAU96812.1 hypothetical protein DQG13_19860 [Paenibacillus sp. YN15]
MGGFNVLNEIAGAPITEVTGWGFIALFLFVAGVVIFVLAAIELEGPAVVFGLFLAVVFGAILLVFGYTHETGEYEPTRYEITLKPGAIIDATRWDIVSHRGEIYVIQERKPSAD